MSRWADIKEYDDDHDGEWFEEENKRLGKDYLSLIHMKSPFRKKCIADALYEVHISKCTTTTLISFAIEGKNQIFISCLS